MSILISSLIAAGTSGYSGISGWSGTSGISGWSGSGISGWSGTSGISGWSGSGISGWSGSGISGWSGTSGISGWSGSGGGLSLSSVAGVTTYYVGLSATASGTWSDARVDSTNLYYTAGNQTLYSTNFNTSSDARIKDNVKGIENSLSTLNQLRGVEFNWKHSGNKSYGVIAQEIENVLPELVSTIKDTKSVNYNALIGFLIEAVKELSDKVSKLENK